MKKLIFITFALLLSTPIFASTEIREAVLAEDIVERNPSGSISETQACGNEESPASVNSDSVNKIYLWNRVSNNEDTRLIHSWQQKVDDEWSEQANVSLRIGVSGGWRTWSSKNLDPYFHKGDWRVVISTVDEPEETLCVVHFSVN